MIPGLVSTIIPVYNRPMQLREAVDSVLTQDYRPIEIIIVDDGSSDDTLSVAQAYQREHPDIIRVVSQANGGPGKAREHGRQLAQGEFIQYLDSDDILLPNKFSNQTRALQEEPLADVAYGITWLRMVDGRLITTPHKYTGRKIDSMFPSFLLERWWETATPLYRSSICDKAGPWSDLWLEEDWEYDCRIAATGARLAWCAVPVSEHRDHPGVRLSRGSAKDKARNKTRAVSHSLIYAHAGRAGLQNTPEMQHFARALFLLARQCGAAGLAEESRSLFTLAKQASGEERSKKLDFRFYQLAASMVGWNNMGRLSCWLDGLRQ